MKESRRYSVRDSNGQATYSEWVCVGDYESVSRLSLMTLAVEGGGGYLTKDEVEYGG